ncbi:DUF397 domain-containing protein [Streptomyces prunicolor]|uniref:DUF397 domain-containing protein n=1 Tax=Streptomyces prunicolor TaxID=67348 RepID=UPI00371FB077
MSIYPDADQLALHAAWFKSTYSSEAGGNCVEVANLISTQALVAVRDSKLPSGPALVLPPEAFAALIDDVKESRP